MSDEEKLLADEIKKEKNREQYRRRRQREREREEELRRQRKAEMRRREEIGAYQTGKRLGAELVRQAHKFPEISCQNQTGGISFDVETTGLSNESDEILQLSIVDLDGNTLLNTYVKPWEEAEAIHGITPDMVENASYPHELIPVVKGIFKSAKLLVGYNIAFDLGMLSQWGITPDENHRQVDVMEEYARLHSYWDEHYQNWKWKKLTEAAAYYGYEFKAHDSLEDALATLYVHKKVEEEKQEYIMQQQKQQEQTQKTVKIKL